MNTPMIWSFFYGSYMNAEVLGKMELELAEVEVAQLDGFALRIEPLANLVRSEAHSVFGLVGRLTHADLDELYSHARDVLGGYYLPEAVLVRTSSGRYLPAMCWISHDLEAAPAESAYVDRVLAAAVEYGFPQWYLERIESFKPE